MSEDSGRIAARKKATAAQEEWRAQQAPVMRRRRAWATQAAVAIGERDEAIERCEQRAGIALAKLVQDGLGLDDAVAWTGGAVTVRQARALIARVSGHHETGDDRDGAGDSDENVDGAE